MRNVGRVKVCGNITARYTPLSRNGNAIHYGVTRVKKSGAFVTFLYASKYRPLDNSGKLIANYSGMDRRSNINYELIDIIKL